MFSYKKALTKEKDPLFFINRLSSNDIVYSNKDVIVFLTPKSNFLVNDSWKNKNELVEQGAFDSNPTLSPYRVIQSIDETNEEKVVFFIAHETKVQNEFCVSKFSIDKKTGTTEKIADVKFPDCKKYGSAYGGYIDSIAMKGFIVMYNTSTNKATVVSIDQDGTRSESNFTAYKLYRTLFVIDNKVYCFFDDGLEARMGMISETGITGKGSALNGVHSVLSEYTGCTVVKSPLVQDRDVFVFSIKTKGGENIVYRYDRTAGNISNKSIDQKENFNILGSIKDDTFIKTGDKFYSLSNDFSTIEEVRLFGAPGVYLDNPVYTVLVKHDEYIPFKIISGSSNLVLDCSITKRA